jgi:16S rRNA (adenine1518-N6/adenine1519-N6)-dimethyltransferase
MRFRPTELQHLLRTLGERPKRSLSQNFLIDGNVLKKMVLLAEVKEGDLIIEIGSGPGALTEALLDAGATVIAIEKDLKFAGALEGLQRKDSRLEVIAEDFLSLSIETLLQKRKKAKVVANLPYQITTPILSRLLPLHRQIDSLTLMVQREVAARYIAKEGTADYSSFTLFLQYYATASYGFTVPPTCFYPRPKIYSATVKLLLKEPPSAAFPSQLIRTSFQQRRKMVRTSLKALYPAEIIEGALNQLGLNPQIRPEELSLTHFFQLDTMIRSLSHSENKAGETHCNPNEENENPLLSH